MHTVAPPLFLGGEAASYAAKNTVSPHICMDTYQAWKVIVWTNTNNQFKAAAVIGLGSLAVWGKPSNLCTKHSNFALNDTRIWNARENSSLSSPVRTTVLQFLVLVWGWDKGGFTFLSYY